MKAVKKNVVPIGWIVESWHNSKRPIPHAPSFSTRKEFAKSKFSNWAFKNGDVRLVRVYKEAE